jgi:hypothetical protein
MYGIRRLSGVLAVGVTALAVAASPAGAASPSTSAEAYAPASARGVTEFQVEARWIDSLAQSGDGTFIYDGMVGTR